MLGALSPLVRPAAWQCLVGGVLLHLVLGTLYLFGNINVYIASYLRLYDPTITSQDVLVIYSAAMAGQASVMVAGGMLQCVIGIRKTAFLGGWLLACGVLFSSAARELPAFVVFYGLFFGWGIGLSYSCPLACGFRWLPQKRGFVSGVVVAGFGGGAFVFNFVATGYVNPSDVRPTILYNGQLYFGPEVAARVPGMLRLLGSCYLAMVTMGAALLRVPPTVSEGSCGVPGTFKGRARFTRKSSSSASEEISFACVRTSDSTVTSCNGNDDDSISSAGADGAENGIIATSKFSGRSGGYNKVPELSVAEPPLPRAGAVLKLKFNNHQRSQLQPSNSSAAPPQPAKNHTSASSPMRAENGDDHLRRHDDNSALSEVEPLGNGFPAAEQLTPREILRLPMFWGLFGCFVLSAVGGLIVAGCFKNLAARNFASDHFLAGVASCASVANALGRLCWGAALDRYGCGRALVALNAGAFALLATYGAVIASGREMAFLLWTSLLLGFYGGNFAIFPAATAEFFGDLHAGSNYGMVFTGFAVFSSIGVLSAKALASDGGYGAILDACTVLQLAGLVASLVFWQACVPRKR